MTFHFRSSVGQFHRATGEVPFRQLNRHERVAMAALRAVLLTEEGRELHEADNEFRRQRTDESWMHLAKEMADLAYVAAGTADIFSTPLMDPRPHHGDTHPVFFLEGIVMDRVARVVKELDDLGRIAYAEWDDAEVADKVDELGSEIQELVFNIGALADGYRIPLTRVFDAVHASNMSKVDPVTHLAERRADGKVLKGPNFRPADLTFLHNAA